MNRPLRTVEYYSAQKYTAGGAENAKNGRTLRTLCQVKDVSQDGPQTPEEPGNGESKLCCQGWKRGSGGQPRVSLNVMAARAAQAHGHADTESHTLAGGLEGV